MQPIKTVDTGASSGGDQPQQPSFRRRDHLMAIEQEVQRLWDMHKAFEARPDLEAATPETKNKFFCTFPYPYMNGRLHLGHAFTVTKAEFQARYQRLKGKNVLWPFAFHCTGMPIAACADKLKREIEQMKTPAETTTDGGAGSGVESPTTNVTVAGQFHGKRSKAVAKSGPAKTQWEIMGSCGVPEELIPEFQDAQFWLQYFPPLAKSDLQRFGLAADWRRSFITTDRNPYYDAFIRWQFNTLRRRNVIKFGMRPSIFSRVDGQPCADHDRASGEGAMPQEYTLIKIRMQRVPKSWDATLVRDRAVYMVAATLRPETMYGQTNCFVLPEGEYGVFVAFDTPVAATESGTRGILQKSMSQQDALAASNALFVCSQRSAENMCYQGTLPADAETHRPICLFRCSGQELIGAPLSAPLAQYETVYALPMLGISMDKGTGIVTSVPSDAPDDYAALRDLQEKPLFREKYGVTDEMMKFDVVEIIDIPGMGRRAAVDICIAKKIKSQNDKTALAAAKEEVYKKGFYEGVLVVGPHAGSKVSDAKAKVREDMIQAGQAGGYFEPERKVMSRSGDECVVALCDQWYIDYADPEWKDRVSQYVLDTTKFEAYSPRCLHQLKHVVSWLREWACSRHYGLGTSLPWDKNILIESLSDSTIYMAYYTIAHLLQGDMNGDVPGHLGVTPDQMTDAVFDYVFMMSDSPPTDSPLSQDKLDVHPPTIDRILSCTSRSCAGSSAIGIQWTSACQAKTSSSTT